MQPYQYQPLPSSSSIRILILHPAAGISSPLECDIITKDRLTLLRDPNNKSFDAVSYVWGNGTHDIPLFCKHEGTYLYISAVVDEMLRNLRKACEVRRLWVDAICLNQKDNQEKSIQVQQMGQIYHMADKVHIWLGPADATTRLAFAFLRTLVAKFEPLPGQAKDPTTEEILQTFEEIFQHRNFQSFLSLLQKSWFTRRWTLQEGFLARDAILRCGDSKVSWHWFTEGLKHIRRRSEELQGVQSDHSALYALNVLKTLKEPADLLSLLWSLHMSQCSDHRDRIYSLLGLAQNTDPVPTDAETFNNNRIVDSWLGPFADGRSGHMIKSFNSKQELPIPDYALSADTLYRGFAEDSISNGRFLEILLHIDAFGRLSDVNPNWPSWVPNWTRARDRKLDSPTAMSRLMPPIVCIRSRDEGYFNKTLCPDELLYPQPTVYSYGNDHELIIYGKFLHGVVNICDTWPESDSGDHLVNYLTDCIRQEFMQNTYPEIRPYTIKREVEERLLFLVTGSEFFGYARHMSSLIDVDIRPRDWWSRGEMTETLDPSPWFSKCKGLAKVIYPVVEEAHSYTLEQIRLKEHLDQNYHSNPPPTPESRQELSDVLDDLSRMMREGKKRLIATSVDLRRGVTKRRDWIAPDDVRMGDVIADITHCGRVGVLLRPIDSSEIQLTFQLIGIAWSLDVFHKHKNSDGRTQEFHIV